MREIKFRGWWKDTKEPILDFMEEYTMDVLNDSPDNPFIYSQFTGLLDKNSKEIWEGDKWKLGDEIYLIVWHQGDLQTGWKKKAGEHITDIGKDNACKGEVIGNIYSNPELLSPQTGKEEGR